MTILPKGLYPIIHYRRWPGIQRRWQLMNLGLGVLIGQLVCFINLQTGHAASPKKRYDLNQLIALAKKNYPGIKSAQQAVAVMEAQLFQARWAWIPQGTVEGFLTISPDINCIPNEENCQTTNRSLDITDLSINGVYGRVELKMGMPIYTFGKLSAAKRAAQAGVAISRAQVRVSEETVIRDVAKAYWAVKLAREILYTVDEGQGILEKARKRIDQELEEGEGEATLTDLLRLNTFSAEIDTRKLEAKKLEQLTLATLATLIGHQGPLSVDKTVLEPRQDKPLALANYLSLAQRHRPELQILQWAQEAFQAAIDLEKARFFSRFFIGRECRLRRLTD